MVKIDTLLVPTDFSPFARRALDVAFDLARRCNAAVHLLYVEVLHGEVAEHIRKQMDEWVASAPEGISIRQDTMRSVAAAPAILNYADENDVDVIVMGTHGRRGVSRVLLGSVAGEVVQRARRAVLTIRGSDEEEGADFDFPPRRILAPVDFSESSRFALRYAKELARFYGAELRLLHVVEDRFHPAFYGPGMMSIYDVDPGIERKACKQLENLYQDTEGPSGPFSVTARPGNPAREIVREAEDGECQLTVIATHGLTGLEHFFLGSVAERVVRLASTPVFTVKTFAKPLIQTEAASTPG